MYPTLKAHDNLCFPPRRAYLLLYVFTFCLSQGDPHLSLFHFILWQALRVWKIMIIYIQLDVSWHRLLLLTSPKGEYVGRQHNKPLSFSVSSWHSITTIIAWVLTIMGDYEIVEYVKFAESKLWHRPFLKIRWTLIVWWLITRFVNFQESLWSIL